MRLFARRPDRPGPVSRETAVGVGQPTYPPIADYGIIGDARSSALISRSGSVDWWCLPNFDGDPVFARLLDNRLGGFFAIRPNTRFDASRGYVRESNILQTTFTTSDGVARLTDFMPALTEAQKRLYPVPFREIVRRIQGVSGAVPIRIEVRVRPQFGSTTPLVRRIPANRYAISWGNQAIHLASSHPLGILEGSVIGEFTVHAGDRIDLALAYSPEAPADLPILRNLDLIESLTARFWESWTSQCRYQGPYRDSVIRSALALKLLTYAPSGAIVAAPTTSLPEQIGGSRNWDYRYCWPRDAAFTIRALLRLGYTIEAHAFAEWLLYSTRITDPVLKTLYDVYGGRTPRERIIESFEGYRGSRPVRVGNAARRQFQLDVYGEVLDALALYRRAGGSFDRDGRKLISGAANIVLKNWLEPDDGIWEPRTPRQQNVHSKVLAWVALERTIELSRSTPLYVDTTVVRETKHAIRRWIIENGYSPELGSFVRRPGTRELDASLLVIPLVDFLPGDDARVIGTVDAVRRHLARGALVLRHLGSDGLTGVEGTFLICSFWLVEALARTGKIDAAIDLFEGVIRYSNDLGLMSEEVDPGSGELLGNFPQGFSHIGLINAALTLADYTR